MPVIRKFSYRKKLVAFDKVAHAVLNSMSSRFLLVGKNIGYIPTLQEYMHRSKREVFLPRDGKDHVDRTMRFRQNRQIKKNKQQQKDGAKQWRKRDVLCVVCDIKDFSLRDDMSDIEFFHLPTNAFLDPDKDNRISGMQVKMIGNTAIQWTGDPLLTSREYGDLGLEPYVSSVLKEKDGVVCGPGVFRFEFVWSPDRIKRMESVAGGVYRIVYLRTDGKYSYFQLTNDFCYKTRGIEEMIS